MKYLTILILITLYVTNADAYEFSKSSTGENLRWYETEIDIYLDSSLENIAPAEKIYPVVEDSVLVWTDYIDEEITVNFVYEECQDQPVNCIYYGDAKEHLGITAWIYNSLNQIFEADIVIADNVNWGLPEDDTNANVKKVLTHETGHFWGMSHSQDKDAIMYPTYTNNSDELSSDDINGIQELYGSKITEFPEIVEETEETIKIEEEKPTHDKHLYAPCCSFSGKTSITKSIFNLLF